MYSHGPAGHSHSPAGYSYGGGGGNQHFDDYHDGPSSTGPKSFVSVSNRLNGEGGPDGVINIDHQAYAGPAPRPYRGDTGGADDYEPDPLHPLRDYHATGHDDEDMYVRLRHEYQSKARAQPSPYFRDYGYEPSSNAPVRSTGHRDQRSRHGGGGGGGGVGNGGARESKAYWRMSYVQDV